MIKSKYAWDIKHPESKITDDIASKYKLTPIVKKILESKGLTDANTIESLLSDDGVLHNPMAMSDMQKAVETYQFSYRSKSKKYLYMGTMMRTV
ncbi:single-strand DNA-specific exonuclease [Staphylococcus gallinarum]|uniref:Single-strand DNA-specific exonuclease n=1 Tax=Staphylococcus gallinarum TaxID=1293 RepID=A0A380FHF6_STAGA|nr:single-strand DNA-specific exonuclease [Staphylococcus gallinarum]